MAETNEQYDEAAVAAEVADAKTKAKATIARWLVLGASDEELHAALSCLEEELTVWCAADLSPPWGKM